MNRRSFIRTCCGGVAGLVLGGSLPATVAKQGGGFPECIHPVSLDCPPFKNIHIAGCTIWAGDVMVLDPDGFVRPMRDWDDDYIGVASSTIERGEWLESPDVHAPWGEEIHA